MPSYDIWLMTKLGQFQKDLSIPTKKVQRRRRIVQDIFLDLRLNPRSCDGDTKFLFVQVAKPVTWKEPQFTDNVKIEHVMTRFESIANQAIGCCSKGSHFPCPQRNTGLRHGIRQTLGDLPGDRQGEEHGEVRLHNHCCSVQAGPSGPTVSFLRPFFFSLVFLATKDNSMCAGGSCVGWAIQGGRLGCSCQRWSKLAFERLFCGDLYFDLSLLGPSGLSKHQSQPWLLRMLASKTYLPLWGSILQEQFIFIIVCITRA